MKLSLHGSLGDTVAVTAVVREIRYVRPLERITLDVRYPEVFEGNPHLVSGTHDDGSTIQLPLGGDGVHHLVDAYASACGMMAASVRPELHLASEERVWADLLCLETSTIAIDTWAGWPSRRWSFMSWMTLVDRLILAGYSVIEVGESVTDCDGNRRSGPLPNVSRSFLDRATLRHTAALLERCALFVGSDSGLFHVAAAVGTPQVVMFGPIPAAQRAYDSTLPIEPSSCEQCSEHCHRTPPCMATILPSTVHDAIDRVHSQGKFNSSRAFRERDNRHA